MFNLGFGELMIILLLAFLVVGPADLPKVARAIARLYKKARRLWDEVLAALDLDVEIKDAKSTKKEVETAIREANPIAQLQSEIDETTKIIGSVKKDGEKQMRS